MCYRCKICDTVTADGEPRKLHIIYREVGEKKFNDTHGEWEQKLRKEIAKEIPVCKNCKENIDWGVKNNIPINSKFLKRLPAKLYKWQVVVSDNHQEQEKQGRLFLDS